MNFLFVDRIFEFEPFKRAKGIKHVVASDPYMKTDAEGRKILSPCIIGEALGQLTAWIVMEGNNFSKRPVAGIVDEVTLSRDIYAGETIVLHTEIDELNDQSVLYNSYATVCGEKVFSLRYAMGPLLPMEDFIEPHIAREQFNMIYRLGKLTSNTISAPAYILPEIDSSEDSDIEEAGFYLEEVEYPELLSSESFFDHILDFQPQSVTAQKNISLLAPYFVDHFPRKPVLPLTLLLEGQLELASFFLKRILGEAEACRFRPVQLQKIRIKQFIMPGDSIVITLHLKEKVNQRFLFGFKTQVDDKVICSIEAVFEAHDSQNVQDHHVDLAALRKV